MPRPFITAAFGRGRGAGEGGDVLGQELLWRFRVPVRRRRAAQVDRGCQVGQGLAGARARLGEEQAAVAQATPHRLGKAVLRRTLFVAGEGGGQEAVTAKEGRWLGNPFGLHEHRFYRGRGRARCQPPSTAS